MWHTEFGPLGDVVLSSRVRLARNIDGFLYVDRMTEKQQKEVIDKCCRAIPNLKYIDFDVMTIEEKTALAECHIISPDMVKNSRRCGILTNNDCTVSIMLNEEDHIRIQAMASGFNLDECLEKANEADDEMEKTIDYGYNKKFGYLTCCPTNVGTGMRASVMVHLPALTESGRMEGLVRSITKLGLTVRGIYGEGSGATGNIYQISNQVTLGVSEQEIIEKLKQVTNEVVEKERELSRRIYEENKFGLENKIMRSYGILTNAVIMTSSEAMNLISDVRWGINLGIIKGVDLNRVNELMYDILPGGMMKKYNLADASERDLKRAEILRDGLKKQS